MAMQDARNLNASNHARSVRRIRSVALQLQTSVSRGRQAVMFRHMLTTRATMRSTRPSWTLKSTRLRCTLVPSGGHQRGISTEIAAKVIRFKSECPDVGTAFDVTTVVAENTPWGRVSKRSSGTGVLRGASLRTALAVSPGRSREGHQAGSGARSDRTATEDARPSSTRGTTRMATSRYTTDMGVIWAGAIRSPER